MMGVLCCWGTALMVECYSLAPPSLCEGGASKRSDASGGCSGRCGVQVVVDEDWPIPSACIPCEIRFALSRPLRFAKGRIRRRLRSFPISARSPSPGTAS